MNMDPLYVGPSQNRQAWHAALSGQDDALLSQLAEGEPPGVAHFEIATYINGLYRMTQHPFFQGRDVRPDVERVLPTVHAIRRRLGWRQRELDIGLMRWIRRASALSVVIGAGVTMAAGGPSWAELVRLLLKVALEKGHEITQMVPTPDSTPGHETYERQVIRVERFKPEAEEEARHVLALIEMQQADTEALMRGAQLCYDLFSQHLFTHITQILYPRAPQPSPIHRAIAELAYAQHVPDRGPGLFPGWDSIISYNFDDLMGEALTEQQVPHAAWAMRGGEIVGDPDELAKGSDWHQPIFHLHGYTPRRLFLITNVEFVFSTAQYFKVYGGQRSGIIDRALNQYLANPVHVSLYIGCSFSDEAMNDLLREAARRYPGRFHFALLRLPGVLRGQEPTSDQLEAASARYRDMGVQPIWVHDYDEIPEIIRSLK
jgi:hypothetical protein